MKAWDLASRDQFHQYILLCIGRMSASTLRLSKGLGTDKRPYERLYQVEWYNVGTANAGLGAVLSPDVGAVSLFCTRSLLVHLLALDAAQLQLCRHFNSLPLQGPLGLQHYLPAEEIEQRADDQESLRHMRSSVSFKCISACC